MERDFQSSWHVITAQEMEAAGENQGFYEALKLVQFEGYL